MSEERKRNSWRYAVFGLLIVILFYPLSTGPLARITFELWKHQLIDNKTYYSSNNWGYYQPMKWMRRRSTSFKQASNWYGRLWVSTDEYNKELGHHR